MNVDAKEHYLSAGVEVGEKKNRVQHYIKDFSTKRWTSSHSKIEGWKLCKFF